MIRVSIALLLALSVIVVALSAALPTMTTNVVALDDDDDDGGGDDGGDDSAGGLDEDDDEDANRGNGNDDDGDDDDNPGRGQDKDKDKDKKRKDDEESSFVTPVSTNTPARQAEPIAEPTTGALTPVSSPTATATPTPTTGTLVIRLRACPDGTDPAVGTDALREECPVGEPDADFELSGRSGLFNGWRRDVRTDDDGDARVTKLGEGTYSLTLDELDWCAAEASSVEDGLIVIEPGETTEVTAYLCGDPAPSTPTGS